ncbi:hypothetical protein LIA77_02626 [Sarocladium implicatum]|nr:hypothetical protein LIA77_02626 [Sarocladium implicatum]
MGSTPLLPLRKRSRSARLVEADGGTLMNDSALCPNTKVKIRASATLAQGFHVMAEPRTEHERSSVCHALQEHHFVGRRLAVDARARTRSGSRDRRCCTRICSGIESAVGKHIVCCEASTLRDGCTQAAALDSRSQPSSEVQYEDRPRVRP